MPDSLNTQLQLYRTPTIFGSFPSIIAAESTRHGGVSMAPYASLNLGGSTDDAPENVAENRRRLWESLGVTSEQVASAHQVHGSEVLRITLAGRHEGYDALITNQPGILLAITIADCTPVLIYDARQQAIAAIHAGWRGTVGQIVLKTIQEMQREFGTNPADCVAYVGTCIDECSFEVGDEVAVQFEDAHKWFNTSTSKYFVNLKKANYNQLLSAGLPSERVEISPFSTVNNNDDYFSYRLEKGITGRMLACIGLF